VDLVIHNGLKDWVTGTSYSGGQNLEEDEEETTGAVTVANLNNTDGDFDAGGNEIVDVDETDVSVAGMNPPGRNEIDLMKLVVWFA
jgi:hypothetical protein